MAGIPVTYFLFLKLARAWTFSFFSLCLLSLFLSFRKSKMKSFIQQYWYRNLKLKQNGLTYSEYLQSKEWKEVKIFLRQFPQFNCCAICGQTFKLHFHHLSYSKLFEKRLKLQKTCIVRLCSKHHTDVHEISRTKNYGLKQAFKHIKQNYLRNNGNVQPL